MQLFKKIFPLLMLNFFSLSALPLSVEKKPFAVAFTPHSILRNNSSKVNPLFVGDRTRLSTCTGVAWFLDNFLAAVDLTSSSIQVYNFQKDKNELLPTEYLNNKKGMQLDRPENLSFSADFNWLAVPNIDSSRVNIYKVNKEKATIYPKPFTFVEGNAKKCRIHGVRFSPDSKYFAYVSMPYRNEDSDEVIRIYKIKESENNIEFTLIQTMKCSLFPYKPKAIDFSLNNKYVAVCYCKPADSKKAIDAKGIVKIYKFNGNQGIDPNPVSSATGYSAPEDLRFYSDYSCVLVCNQGNDSITCNEFDAETGQIGETQTLLKSPAAELSFPHGISISPDGRFLAASNYGDDKVTVYSIK